MPHANTSYYNPIIVWSKPITYPGVKPGMYSVTSEGNVINNITGKMLSQAVSYAMGGYRSVGLQMVDGSRKTFGVHRLVAHEYIPKTEEDISLGRDTVHHKDMYTDDNYCYNLEYLTEQENFADAAERYAANKATYMAQEQKEKANPLEYTGWGNTPSKGEKNGMAKLTEAEVHEICKLLEQGKTIREVINDMGYEYTDNTYYNINHIKNGHRWCHVSSQYDIPSANRNKD